MTLTISQKRNPKSEGIPKDEVRENHPAALESKNDFALLHKEQRDFGSAEQLLLGALYGGRLKLGDTHPHTNRSLNDLIDLYKAWNKPQEADTWRAKLTPKEVVYK